MLVAPHKIAPPSYRTNLGPRAKCVGICVRSYIIVVPPSYRMAMCCLWSRVLDGRPNVLPACQPGGELFLPSSQPPLMKRQRKGNRLFEERGFQLKSPIIHVLETDLFWDEEIRPLIMSEFSCTFRNTFLIHHPCSEKVRTNNEPELFAKTRFRIVDSAWGKYDFRVFS